MAKEIQMDLPELGSGATSRRDFMKRAGVTGAGVVAVQPCWVARRTRWRQELMILTS
ncbi:MAG TPA: twin-arginine translocation signal domain-containing protein [Terriglobia bacterium]|nr:twin-arginine translocation signal domain-containing protein [Terriglobia bacterium]